MSIKDEHTEVEIPSISIDMGVGVRDDFKRREDSSRVIGTSSRKSRRKSSVTCTDTSKPAQPSMKF